MKTLALVAQKGGAGKTTLAVHLAVLAGKAGLSVVLVDCDPQKSAAMWWKSRAAATPLMVETPAAGLGKVLDAARADAVDLVVIDTRPSVEAETLIVLHAADFSLIPIRPATLDLRAVAATAELARVVKAPAAFVLNHGPPARGTIELVIVAEARAVLDGYGLPTCPVAIAQRVALAAERSASSSQTAGLLMRCEPYGPGHERSLDCDDTTETRRAGRHGGT